MLRASSYSIQHVFEVLYPWQHYVKKFSRFAWGTVSRTVKHDREAKEEHPKCMRFLYEMGDS